MKSKSHERLREAYGDGFAHVGFQEGLFVSAPGREGSYGRVRCSLI